MSKHGCVEVRDDFSVLICVYAKDDPELFLSAMQSIFLNTLLPTAVILVVDGLVPQSLQDTILFYERNYNVKVIWLRENRGFVAALNEGLQYVETEWVVRADADDHNLESRFSILNKHMTPDLDLIGSFVAEKDENGSVYCVKKVPLNPGDISNLLRRRNPFIHPSVAYRVEKVRRVGGYPDVELREDYALWASMIANGSRVKNIPDVLVQMSFGDRGFQRRKGGAVLRAEVKLQKHLLSLGLTSPAHALFFGLLRTSALALPSAFIKVIYSKILRR